MLHGAWFAGSWKGSKCDSPTKKTDYSPKPQGKFKSWSYTSLLSKTVACNDLK